MRVALDATPLSVPTGGITRYTTELHRALTAAFPEDQFELLEPRPGHWWSIGLPRVLAEGRFDLFHGTDFAVPYVPVTPAVMTLHDLSPWHDDLKNETSERVRRRTPWLLRLGLASTIVTPTESIRNEAIAKWNLAPGRVRAIPHGVSPMFRPRAATADRAQPYFVLVGTKGRRKNVDVAIAAARAVGVELRIAGRGDWPQSPGVRVLGAVSDDTLPGLYAGAAALLFPALYEGFGLPVLEAMACGTPVVASQDPALVEVCGGAALHAAAGDGAAWAQAARTALAQRSHWSELGLKRAGAFTWQRTAEMTRQWYEETLCRRAR
jgi:glycosyltransferase involved in cell wall biosynthesis